MPNPHQDLIDSAQQQASKANANSSGDRYIAQATVSVIESNGRVEEAINNFNAVTTSQANETKELAAAQVKLAKAQVFFAKVAIGAAIVAIVVAIYSKFA